MTHLALQQTQTNGGSEKPYTIGFDEPSRVVRILMGGFWSVEMAYIFAGDFEAAAQRYRSRSRQLRFLIDGRGMAIQSADVKAILVKQVPYREGDRVAVIVEGILPKIAANRYMQSYSNGIAHEAFTSVEEAEVWLGASG